jgi:hemolysin D
MKRLYIGLKNKIEHFFDVSLAKDVHQFKPSIVAIQDDPASPAGRIVAWTLCLIILTAIIWSCIAKIDIIATATGQIVPVGNTKVIQSHIDATIKNINIKEGDFVKKGDLLIELDDERYSSEKESLEKMLAAENVKYNRANAMLNYIDRKVIEKLPLVEFQSISPRLQEMLFEQEYRDLDSSVSMLNEMIDQKKYELESVVNNINHYKQTVNLTEIRAKKFKGLLDQKVSSELEFMEFEEKRIREKNELNTLISREKQTAANIKELNEKVKYTIIENKKRQLATIEESFNNINKVKEEINKNEILIKYSKITSPVNGYIQELKFHTIGGVMEQAQEVLKIVEDKSDIEVETMVLSKDIGFVHKGMEVAIKVDSFLFTKYGLVHGTVTNISEDAIKDEKMGLVYKTKIKLKEKTVHVDGKEIDLSYGMGVTSEIKTGTRTVMEFFLSPIIKKMNESINER